MMLEGEFSKWTRWSERGGLDGIKYPGIYACAISNDSISETDFNWVPEIVYIGMTNSLAGLKGRLKQFDNTIIGKAGHGGADRVRYKHQDYDKLVSKLYVAISSFKCDVKLGTPKDLRAIGRVAKFKYDCFASFSELFGNLPEFNNKNRSPKYSLTFGRGEYK